MSKGKWGGLPKPSSTENFSTAICGAKMAGRAMNDTVAITLRIKRWSLGLPRSDLDMGSASFMEAGTTHFVQSEIPRMPW
jgi:hypothetical protein